MKRKMTILGMYIWLLIFLAVGLMVCKCTSRCSGSERDTVSVDSIIKHDTVYVVKHDTLPVEKTERVVRYVKIPVYTQLTDTVTLLDSVRFDVVQKMYSDDSTYTAYVSGLKHEELPKLDSIAIRQREIVRTVEKTVTVWKQRSRWNIGLQAGYGDGFAYKGFEPYVGVGVGYALFPP